MEFRGLSKRVSCAKTDRRTLTIYTLYDVFSLKDVPFGDAVDNVDHLGVVSPKPLFCRRE